MFPSSNLATFTLLYALRCFRFVLILIASHITFEQSSETEDFLYRKSNGVQKKPATVRALHPFQNLSIHIANGVLGRSL